MQFKNVIAQDAAKQGLLNMWKHNTFPHALLIVGAEGTGGLPLSLALAQYIMCENKQDEDSCGQCANCNKISKMEHADLHFSFPTIPPNSNTKAMSRHYIKEFRAYVKQNSYGTTYDWLQYIEAENKQGNITAEECREIIDNLNLKSYEGGKKIHIMWRPEYLGKEGNILLKLIEEPPKDTIMIFVAENTEDILLTIRSRTQTVRLAPLNSQQIATALEAAQLASAAKAQQIAQIAHGNYSEALKLVQHAENDLFPEVRNLFNSVFVYDGAGLSKFADNWSKAGREQQKNFLNYIIQLLEQTIRCRYTPEVPLHLPPSEAEFVKKLANMKVPVEAFNEMSQEISNAIMYIERNAHSKTMLLTLGIKLRYVVQRKPIPVAI